MGRVQDKVTIITGAGGGIGRQAALRFAEEGAKVVIADIVDDGGKETAKLIEAAGGEALFVHTDVTDGKSVKAMVAETVKHFGRIDVLFNNAGIQGNVHLDVAHMSEEVFDQFMAVNVKGVWNCIHYAANELVKSKGVIVNTASYAADRGNLGSTGYGVSKGAVRTMTFCVANELGIYGVRCNCISPYTALTDRIKQVLPADRIRMTEEGTAMFQMIDVGCIANTALFLASDESCAISGFDLRVDAGAGTKGQPKPIDEWKRDNPYPIEM